MQVEKGVCLTHEAALLDLSSQRHKDTKDTKEYERFSDLVTLCLRGYFHTPTSYLGHTRKNSLLNLNPIVSFSLAGLVSSLSRTRRRYTDYGFYIAGGR